MKTLVQPAPTPAEAPWQFLPPAVFSPFQVGCVNSKCNAVLLLDDPTDIRYGYQYTMYGDYLTFRLYTSCLHCNRIWVLEEYGAVPGNPAALTPRPGWDARVALSTRSAAYRLWAADVTTEDWDWIFWQTDVRYWSAECSRDSRKMQARLRPGAQPILLTRHQDPASPLDRSDAARALQRGLPEPFATEAYEKVNLAGSPPGAARRLLVILPDVEQAWTGTRKDLAAVRGFVAQHFPAAAGT